MTAPERAHTIILKAGDDTAEDVAHELEHLAYCIRTNQLSVGCGGGPSGCSIYSYKENPEMTHDAYFRAVAAYLEAGKVSA